MWAQWALWGQQAMLPWAPRRPATARASCARLAAPPRARPSPGRRHPGHRAVPHVRGAAEGGAEPARAVSGSWMGRGVLLVQCWRAKAARGGRWRLDGCRAWLRPAGSLHPRTPRATCPTPWLPLMPAPRFINRRHTQLGLPALLHAHGGPARGHPAHDHPQELRWVGWGWGAPGPGLTAPAGWHAPRPRQCSELRLDPHPAPLCSGPPPSPSPPPQAAPTSSSAATWRAASPA